MQEEPHAAAATATAPRATLGRMALDLAGRDGTAARFPRDGGWHEWSYRELGERVTRLARGLLALGIEPGDRVGLLAETRPEWTVADCAILAAGAVVVPVYATNSPEECRHVLVHSGARAVVCEDAVQVAKIGAIRAECRDLEHVVAMEPAPGVPTLEDVERRADEVPPGALEDVQRTIAAGDTATIVYTSGTTGPPKGCMLTHANVLSTLEMYEQQIDLRPPLIIFLFLPLAHALARVTELVTLHAGGTLAYWSGDARRLVDDLAAIRPTHVPSVPRVFEKVHNRAVAAAGAPGSPRRRLFDASLAIGLRARAAGRRGKVRPPLRAAHALADRVVLRRVRGLFGDRIRLALTGAAPIGPEVLAFFDACGVLVLEGYGMTESTAAGTLNTESELRFGTVGRPLPGTEVSVAPDGELLLRGPHVFPGYYRNPEATAEALTDGWLHTGDLGSVDEDGFVRISGRKKDLIITSSGKNITPSNLESALTECRWIANAVVYGDRRPYLVALLTLDPEELPALAREIGIADGVALADLAGDVRLRALLQQEVERVNSRFARIEQIKRFDVLDHDLTQAAGEMTPTAKVKRNVAYERYADRFDALYR